MGLELLRGPKITHLFFADDTLLFGDASMEEITMFRWTLSLYEEISGQQINLEKSGIYFSPNTPALLKSQICQAMGIPEVLGHVKYLGLPSIIGRRKSDVFQFIKDRIRERIDGWTEKNLSKAGKEILIKSVLEAIPSYAMGCFVLPDGLISEIRSLISGFWWGSGTNVRKTHWASWPSMSRAKYNGGIGFRDLKAFNVALLGKQVWRILTQPHSLLPRIYKFKYFPNCDIFSSVLGNGPSYAWRSFREGIDLLRLGCRKFIASGNTTSIGHDPWLPRPDNFYIRNSISIPSSFSKVVDLIDSNTGWWKLDVLEEFFDNEDIEVIKQIPLRGGNGPDRWAWHFGRPGNYTVKSAYHLVVENPSSQLHHAISSGRISENQKFWKKLWSIKVPKRALHFAWRFATDFLPTVENMRRRTMVTSNVCPLCSDEQTSSEHLFFRCRYAVEAWNSVGLWQTILQFRKDRGDWWFRTLLKETDDKVCELVILMCDAIWFRRNRVIFEGEWKDAREMAAAVIHNLTNFHEANGSFESLSNALLPMYLYKPHGLAPMLFFYAGLCSNSAAILGVVARDQYGTFSRAISKRVENIRDPTLAETMALEEAILLANELGFNNAELIGDALLIINMMHGDVEPSLDCQAIIERIREIYVGGSFSGLYWVPREMNHVAHTLASFAKTSVQNFYSWTSPPIFLSNDSGRFPVT